MAKFPALPVGDGGNNKVVSVVTEGTSRYVIAFSVAARACVEEIFSVS